MDNERLAILKLLIEHPEEAWSIRKISLRRGINYKSAYQAVHKLRQEGAVTLSTYGNTSICTFSRKWSESTLRVEYARLQELLHDKNFKVIHARLSTISSQFILLLFGSYAKKTYTQHSDIDLLLITDKPAEIKNAVELIPLNIHLTVITYAEFITMLKSREFTVVSEAVKKNIILFGMEDYYRMLAHA